jgi:hypothetical protein
MVFRRAVNIFLSKNVNQVSSIYFLDSYAVTYHYGLVFNESNPINRIFNKKIDQLISNGVMQELEKIQSQDGVLVQQSNEQAPQQLTMEHLGICFVAVLIFLGMSLAVFAIECIVSLLKKRKTKSKKIKPFTNAA